MTADPSPNRPRLVIPDGMPTQILNPASVEAELISALIDSGTYNPGAYGVHKEAFRGYGPLHVFATAYQERAGCAPPLHLVKDRFPAFPYVPEISPAWAAHNVLQDEKNRAIRKGITQAMTSLGEEAYNEALGHLRTTVTTVSSASAPGRMLTDFTGTRALLGADICPIPAGRLSDITGGHRAGHLWFIAALWGVGKTFKLLSHAIAAAEGGWDSVIFSMEMPTEEILHRLRALVLASHGPLPMLDLDLQERLMAEWAADKGTIEVRGPDTGRVDAGTISGAINSEHTLVIVDYVGKMFSTDGRHARSDHAVMSLISAELQQTAGLLKVPVLGAAQLNRTGQLGGTIALEQDSDLILHQARVSEAVNGIRKNTIYKTRHTEMPVPWYSRFDPVMADFSDITNDEALAIRLSEESGVWA